MNNWAAREKLLGRPAKCSAPAGCLSGCPHPSVTRGWAKRYGVTWIVRSSSNPTAEGHHRRETTPARTKPSAASEGCWGLTGVRARVGEAGERRSRRRRTSWYRWLLLGRLQSLAPFFSRGGGSGSNSGELLLHLLWREVGEVQRGEESGMV